VIALYKACQYFIKQLPRLLVSLEYQQNNDRAKNQKTKEPKDQQKQKNRKQKKTKNKHFQRYFNKVLTFIAQKILLFCFLGFWVFGFYHVVAGFLWQCLDAPKMDWPTQSHQNQNACSN
jgi:hypothetical protein